MNLRLLLPAASCLTACLLSAPIAAQTVRAWTFDQDPVGAPPAGFLFAAMGQPTPGKWTAERQGTQGYFVHHADPSATGYALAMVGDRATDDIAVSARLRFGSGSRAGGLVWRAQDGQNFYALVLDLAAGELALYRVSSGNRIRLDVEGNLELDPQAWHSLKVIHEESEIRVLLGGVGVFHERDRRYAHKAAPVRVGLLSAGAADVWFDDLQVSPKGERR